MADAYYRKVIEAARKATGVESFCIVRCEGSWSPSHDVDESREVHRSFPLIEFDTEDEAYDWAAAAYGVRNGS